MRQFEVSAAYAVGVLLPVLEVARRRTHFEDIPAYLDDLIMGILLLWAARSASRARPYASHLLSASWGVLCGGLWGSFFGQLRNPDPRDISGAPNAVVVLVKAVIFAVALAALFLSVRRARIAGSGAGGHT